MLFPYIYFPAIQPPLCFLLLKFTFHATFLVKASAARINSTLLVMAVAVELDDDVFFADLSKQLSLLIMDDEEDLLVSPTTSVSLQVCSQGMHPMMQTSMFVQEQNYYGKIQSKGTGVFIPQVSNPRRRNNSNRQHGRHNSSNNSRFQRQSQNSSRGLLQPIQYNNSSYDSFNSRKF